MKIEILLCLPRDANTVGLARRIAAASLAELGITKECLDTIRLALSEASSNVIEHSAADDEYEIQLEVEDDHCEIRVVDTGRGFDAESLSAALPSVDAAAGRGIALMHALMDTTSFESAPERGTVVRLTKALELEPGGALARLLAEPSADGS